MKENSLIILVKYKMNSLNDWLNGNECIMSKWRKVNKYVYDVC